MDKIVRAATPEEIAAAEARNAPKPVARQVTPEGFQAAKTVVLSVPVEFAGQTYTQVSLRRLKGADLLKLRQARDESDIGVLAVIADAPAEVLAELDADDFLQVSELATDFLPRALRAETGSIGATGQGSAP